MPVKRNLDEGFVVGDESSRAKRREYDSWVKSYGKEEADKLNAMSQEDWDNVEFPPEVQDVINEILAEEDDTLVIDGDESLIDEIDWLKN